jgi:hypothetical protein
VAVKRGWSYEPARSAKVFTIFVEGLIRERDS